MDESKYYVSYQGQGVDGWEKHIKIRLVEVDYFPWPTQYNCENGDESFATGECLDVTSGLFAPEVWDIVQPYIKDDGTYPTGICEDYDGNWMLRRCLKTDAEGNEYIAEYYCPLNILLSLIILILATDKPPFKRSQRLSAKNSALHTA